MAPSDVVQLCSELSGRPCKAQHDPVAVLKLLGPGIGLFDEGIASGMSMGAQGAGGDVFDASLQREIGLPRVRLREHIARVVGPQPAPGRQPQTATI